MWYNEDITRIFHQYHDKLFKFFIYYLINYIIYYMLIIKYIYI